ncbi:MAG: hypothetical protein ACSHX8_04990 [Opitutaceae bacterium]
MFQTIRFPEQNLLAGDGPIRSQMYMRLDYTSITRQEFMDFFRDDEMLNGLTADDRLEIFSQVLTGGSDITKELLDSVIADYSVDNLEVIEVDPNRDAKFDALQSVTLDSKSLLTKWGFEDGDCLNWLSTFGEFNEIKVLETLVRVYLLPVLDEQVELCCLHNIHNPIRALKINGEHVSDCWDDEARMEGLVNDHQVVVLGDQVLVVATLLRDAKLILGDV